MGSISFIYLNGGIRLKCTIKDIAELSGFSRSTVSRVLNNSENVDLATKEKIEQTIKQMCYTPSIIARSLVRGQFNLIALIIGDISNPFYADLTKAIEEILYKEGHMIVLCHTNYDQTKEERYIEAVKEYNFAGVIMVTATETESLVANLKSVKCPIVLVNRYLPSFETDTVLVDNYRGAYIATRHLIDLGHKNIAHIYGPQNSTASKERIRGYIDAMKEANLTVDESYLFPGDLKRASGISFAQYLLESQKHITGVFCSNDLTAAGVIDVMTENGKSVPDDLSVVGYDDSQVALNCRVKITTIQQSHYEMGKSAAQMILGRISDNNAPYRQIVFNPQLIIRDSTKSLK
jgi:LacI family transcriptional regulator